MADSLAAQLAALDEADRERVLAELARDPSALLVDEAIRCRASLASFVRRAWPLVRPGDALRWGWHIDAICEHLEAVHRGEIRKLLITVCPGSAKSLLVEVFWPAWMWADDPSRQLVCLASDGDLALRDANRHRDLTKSDWYKRTFAAPAGWEFSASQDAKGYFENTAKGFRYSAGIGGSVTGWRGHGVVMDDLLQANDVRSPPAREAAVYALENVIPSRVNDPARGFFVMVQQRLCVDDPAAWAIAQGDYEHLNLPTEHDPRRHFATYRTVEGHREPFQTDPRTVEGELLFPDLFTPAVIAQAKKNPEMFAAQHQQEPIPPGGGMFKIADWRFWRASEADSPANSRPRGCFDGAARVLPKRFDQVILSLDANFKAKAGADPISLLALGRIGAATFVLARASGPLGFTRTLAALKEMHARIAADYSIRAVLVEDKANGSAIIESIQEEIPGVLAIEPQGGKEARAWAQQPQVQAGQVYLPDGVPWLSDFIAQHAAFPKGRNDDDVDALSQGLAFLREPETIADILMRGGFGAGPVE